MTDPVQAAISRGDAASRVLIAHRDSVIYHLSAILLITGSDGLRACAAGAAEAVLIAASRRHASEGEVLPLPPRGGAA